MEEFLTLDFEDLLTAEKPAETTEANTETEEVEVEDTTEVLETEENTEVVEETVDTETEEVIENEDVPVESSQVKEIYKVLSDVVPLGENEEPTLEWIQEQIDTLPTTLLRRSVEQLNEDAQTVLGYVANKPDFSMSDLVEYVQKYVPVTETDVETIEGARQYLKSNPVFTKLYDADELEEELDRLEDNEKIVAKAKRLKEADDNKKVEEAKNVAKQTQVQKDDLEKQRRQFASKLQEEVKSFGWQKEAVDKVYENLAPERVQFVNSKLKNSPKAVAQLAHIYAHFNEDTAFDSLFEKLEGKKKSKQAQKTKDKLKQSKLSGLVKTTQSNKTTPKGWVPEI